MSEKYLEFWTIQIVDYFSAELEYVNIWSHVLSIFSV